MPSSNFEFPHIFQQCISTTIHPSGPLQLPPQAVALLHPGRGPAHQELQVPALADAPQLQQPGQAPADGDPAAEQPDGAVVPHALPDAGRLRLSPELQGVVLQPADRDGGGHAGVQRGARQEAAQSAEVSIFCGKLDGSFNGSFEKIFIKNFDFLRPTGLRTIPLYEPSGFRIVVAVVVGEERHYLFLHLLYSSFEPT